MRILWAGVFGAAAGFLTRPCCVVPAVMSLAGVSSIGITQAIGPYRLALMSLGGLLLCSAVWMTLRREGGTFNKVFTVSSALVGFAVSLRVLGVL